MVLTPDAVDYVIDRAAQLVAERRKRGPEHIKTLEAERRKVQRELENYLVLIAKGAAPASVIAEINKREKIIATLSDELEEQAPGESELDVRRLRKELRQRLGQFNDLIHSDIPLARQALRKLLTGPLRFTPIERDGRKTYRFEGETTLAALLDPRFLNVASPRGFEPLLPL